MRSMACLMRHGCLLRIAVGGALLFGIGTSMCLATFSPPDGHVDYRFTPSALPLPLSLPVGTVMATTVIPDDVLGRHDDDGQGELWFSDGLGGSGPVITVPTNLAGVGMRLVLESGVAPHAPVASAGGWNVWPALPQMTGGAYTWNW